MRGVLEEAQQFMDYAYESELGPPNLPHLMTIGDQLMEHCNGNSQEALRQVQEVRVRRGEPWSQQVSDIQRDR